jgi:hypothetical protein
LWLRGAGYVWRKIYVRGMGCESFRRRVSLWRAKPTQRDGMRYCHRKFEYDVFAAKAHTYFDGQSANYFKETFHVTLVTVPLEIPIVFMTCF